jgi:hypothetical protein
MRIVRSVLVLAALFWAVANAQDARGKVQGIVTDSTQAVVVGAKVVLTNDDTGVAAAKESNATGHYIFDYVNPGRYTVSVEQPGFGKFVQQNVLVQVRGDVAVNVTLKVGGVAETVTITEVPPAVQFNTSTMDQVVESKMLDAMPVLARNPFALALLNPAVSTGYAANVLLPFNKWQTASFKVGGGAGGSSNDLLLDGAPVQIATAGGYVPSMDSVQEFSVQQNSVDAEFGHSAGGIMSLSMKSGTNEFHGSLYYFGRNPKLNARTNSVTNTPNLVRNSIAGGTVGGPIVKNKLFTFGSYENWHMTEGNFALFTMPTALERTGDFSQSLNSSGTRRTIYDPFSTEFNPATGVVTRTPFPDNVIPSTRQDPTALKMMKDIWGPNNPGINRAGTNNFSLGFPRYFKFWNLSDRTDWNVSDRLKVFGRFSRASHSRDPKNYAGSPAVPTNGYDTQTRDYAGDAVYTLTTNTLLNVRASYSMLIDDLRAQSTEIGEEGYANFWPSKWYTPYLNDIPVVFYPGMNFVGASGTTAIGRNSSWRQHAHTYSYHVRVSSQQGPHYLKAGMESRRTAVESFSPAPTQFYFNAALTAETFNAPKTNLNGDPYATFLLGALNSDSRAFTTPRPEVKINYYGGYVQDDYKLNRRVTLNLGLRWEYTAGLTEKENRVSRYLDLSSPIPEMQSNAPKMPAEVLAYNVPYQYNGAWVFADSDHRAVYPTPKNTFLPRAGLALRVNDKTSLRFGWARYALPFESITTVLGDQTMYGFDATTTVLPVLEGRPQGTLSNPFPATNPLITPVGRAYGRYTNLGSTSTTSWYKQDLRPGINDRVNLSFQRQLPGQFAVDVTWFMNFGHDYGYTKSMNIMDPNLTYQYKAALSASVTNPFYQYLTVDKFPGQLRNQAKVSLSTLLKPYPHYGALNQSVTAGPRERYQALQMRVQRQWSRGFSLLATYVYNREKQEEFFDALATYAGRFTFQNSNQARHRMVLAGTYDLPFGKGRAYLSSVHPVMNGVLGGWSLSGITVVNSGQFLRFGQVVENGAPKVYRTRDKWFETSGITQAPAFTVRTNPLQYEGVTGPRMWNMDMALSKFFHITERFNLEFRMDAYNTTNSFVGALPSTSPTSATFGKVTNQLNQGREMQYTLRLRF